MSQGSPQPKEPEDRSKLKLPHHEEIRAGERE